MARRDLTGQVFGRATALRADGKDRNGNMFWICLCACGKTFKTRLNALTAGKCRSCGCLLAEILAARRRIGPRKKRNISPERRAYYDAKSRCLNRKNARYKDYGGRGIKFLFISFQQFFSHVGARPSADFSLDRINNDGHYELGNVKWATMREQAQHRRQRTTYRGRALETITINGIARTLGQWAVISGINYGLLHNRAQRGWRGARLLSPVRKIPLTNVQA